MIDEPILRPLNGFIGIDEDFDYLIVWMSQSSFVKGAPLLTALWWCWIDRNGRLTPQVARTVVGVCAAIIIGRLLQEFLPARSRPFHDPDVAMTVARYLNPETFKGWSSLPSDHAVLFFAVATAIWFRHRLLGWLAYAWALGIISVPRMMLGFHYASDVAAGAVIGIIIMSLALRAPLPARVDRGMLALQNHLPQLTFAVLFLFSFAAAEAFGQLRTIISGILRALT
jgi:undecaprenyl-diphosphatase